MEFNGTMIIAVMDSDGNSGVYSSSKLINDLESTNWKGGVPTITLRRTDDQARDKIENFRFNIELTGIQPENVRNIQVFASYNYILSKRLKMEMVGLTHLDIDLPNGASMIRADGIIKFA